MKNNTPILIDGAHGEGGGQILRTALTLSMITGTPFEIKNIRAKRKKPGLLRQHLTAVNAAKTISNAKVTGAEMGSQSLHFTPAKITGGVYDFAIGSAGSCVLVLQTILPALWLADAHSTVTVSGGTHNKAAPPADFLIQTWLPLVGKMGVRQVLELKRHGFYPVGGGQMYAHITPCSTFTPLHLLTRGKHLEAHAQALLSNLPKDIGEREIECIKAQLPHVLCEAKSLPNCLGPGNVVLINTHFENVNLVFCGFGEKGLPARDVARNALQQLRAYSSSPAVADEFLADQLLLPMALTGAGSFTAQCISPHFETNVQIIQKFLPIDIGVVKQSEDCYLVTLSTEI